MTHDRLELGRFGEEATASWYEANGYEVVERNYRSGRNEIDLICLSGSTAVFVEVKTRSSQRFGTGVEAVDARKQSAIRQVALAWLASRGRGFQELRFDVVEVNAQGRLTMWQAAF